MTFTRPRDLLITVVLSGILGHLLIRLAYGAFPPLPKTAGFTLVVVALCELVLGFTLRARINRKPGARPVQPLTAARAVALAKASSLAGSVMFGIWAGMFGYVFPLRGEITAAAGDTTTSLIGMGCSVSLVGAALWLEYCCKTPKGPDDSDRPDDRA